MEVQIDSDFESGNIEVIRKIDSSHFICRIKSDDSIPLWFYFRLKNVAGITVTIEIVNAKNCLGGSYSWIKARPVFSYDRRKWNRITDTNYVEDSGVFSFRHRFQRNVVWLSYCYPYTYTDLKNYLLRIEENPYVEVEKIGKTAEGRDIYIITITDSRNRSKDRIGIWAVGRQHAGETPGSYTLEGMIDFLLSEDRLACKMRKRFVYKIVPMVDIDGVCRGVHGKFSKPIDFAEDWRPNPIRPEIKVIRKAIDEYATCNRYDMFLDFHAPTGGDVNLFAIASREWRQLYLRQLEFLSLVEKNNPRLYSSKDFVEWTHWWPSASPSFTAGVSVIDQHANYGVLSFMVETSYNQSWIGEYMTPSLMRALGTAIVKAIWDYYML